MKILFYGRDYYVLVKEKKVGQIMLALSTGRGFLDKPGETGRPITRFVIRKDPSGCRINKVSLRMECDGALVGGSRGGGRNNKETKSFLSVI